MSGYLLLLFLRFEWIFDEIEFVENDFSIFNWFFSRALASSLLISRCDFFDFCLELLLFCLFPFSFCFSFFTAKKWNFKRVDFICHFTWRFVVPLQFSASLVDLVFGLLWFPPFSRRTSPSSLTASKHRFQLIVVRFLLSVHLQPYIVRVSENQLRIKKRAKRFYFLPCWSSRPYLDSVEVAAFRPWRFLHFSLFRHNQSGSERCPRVTFLIKYAKHKKIRWKTDLIIVLNLYLWEWKSTNCEKNV